MAGIGIGGINKTMVRRGKSMPNANRTPKIAPDKLPPMSSLKRLPTESRSKKGERQNRVSDSTAARLLVRHQSRTSKEHTC
jgi:hypothetical protein